MRHPVILALVLVTAVFQGIAAASAADGKVSIVVQDQAAFFAAKAEAYGREIGHCLQEADEARIRGAKVAYAELVVVLREHVEGLSKLDFGDKKEGLALKEAYQKLLNRQTELMTTLLVDPLRIVQDKKLTADERTAKVTTIVEEIQKVENPLVRELKRAIFLYVNPE